MLIWFWKEHKIWLFFRNNVFSLCGGLSGRWTQQGGRGGAKGNPFSQWEEVAGRRASHLLQVKLNSAGGSPRVCSPAASCLRGRLGRERKHPPTATGDPPAGKTHQFTWLLKTDWTVRWSLTSWWGTFSLTFPPVITAGHFGTVTHRTLTTGVFKDPGSSVRWFYWWICICAPTGWRCGQRRASLWGWASSGGDTS